LLTRLERIERALDRSLVTLGELKAMLDESIAALENPVDAKKIAPST
jgi:hypothetical protein